MSVASARLSNEVLRVLEDKLGPRSAQAGAIGECVPIEELKLVRDAVLRVIEDLCPRCAHVGQVHLNDREREQRRYLLMTAATVAAGMCDQAYVLDTGGHGLPPGDMARVIDGRRGLVADAAADLARRIVAAVDRGPA